MSLLHLPQEDRLAAVMKVMTIAHKNGFSGMAGECAEVAVAMNRVMFGGKGQVVAGLNSEFEKHNILVGHFAVRVDDEKFDNMIFDARGIPFSNDELKAWGMLDPSDIHWIESAENCGFIFTEEVAYEAIELEFDEDDALENMTGSGLNLKIVLLKSAMCEAGFTHLLTETASKRVTRRRP